MLDVIFLLINTHGFRSSHYLLRICTLCCQQILPALFIFSKFGVKMDIFRLGNDSRVLADHRNGRPRLQYGNSTPDLCKNKQRMAMSAGRTRTKGGKKVKSIQRGISTSQQRKRIRGQDVEEHTQGARSEPGRGVHTFTRNRTCGTPEMKSTPRSGEKDVPKISREEEKHTKRTKRRAGDSNKRLIALFVTPHVMLSIFAN